MGDIVATNCVHHAVDWICYGVSDSFDNIVDNAEYNEFKHSYTGNLFLDAKRKAVPYAIYVAHNDIQCCENSDVVCHLDGGSSALYYLNDNLEGIKEKLTTAKQEHLNNSLLSTFYNALLIECYSSLELFLSDFVLGKVFTSEDKFIKAQNYCQKKKQTSVNLSVDSIVTRIRNFFTGSFIFHRLDKTKELFRALDLLYPDNDNNIRKFLHLRNNIVHRVSISNIDRMRVTNASEEDVSTLVNAVEQFSQEILTVNAER